MELIQYSEKVTIFSISRDVFKRLFTKTSKTKRQAIFEWWGRYVLYGIQPTEEEIAKVGAFYEWEDLSRDFTRRMKKYIIKDEGKIKIKQQITSTVEDEKVAQQVKQKAKADKNFQLEESESLWKEALPF